MKKAFTQERLSKVSHRYMTLLWLGVASALSACGHEEASATEAQTSADPGVTVELFTIDEPWIEELGHAHEEPGDVSALVVVSGGPVLAHVQDFANAVCNRFNTCAISTYEGHQPTRARALDIRISSAYGERPTDAQRARGNDVAQYALADHDGRFRIQYVIWRQRINSKDGRGWIPMEDRGGITQNHYDHVHVAFNP